MFCLAQLKVCHLLLILKMEEVAVVVLRKAGSINECLLLAYGGAGIYQDRDRFAI